MITHPFHPRRGQRCSILEVQQSSRAGRLVLRTPDGLTIIIPDEWTNRSLPSHDFDACEVSRFDVISLLKVAEMAQRLLRPMR